VHDAREALLAPVAPPPAAPGWFARRKQWQASKKEATLERNRQAAAVRRDHVSTYQRVNRQAQKADFKSELRRAVVGSGQRGAEERLQLSVHLHV
jgi:hypothetical protein